MTIAINSNPELVSAANEFVNNVFYGTLLRQFRDAQKPTILDSGSGGSAFRRMLDGELIKRMSRRGTSSVAMPLVRYLSKNQNRTAALTKAGAELDPATPSAPRRGTRGLSHVR